MLLRQERVDHLRQIARFCPRPISFQEIKHRGRRPRPARVADPDLFAIDPATDGEVEGTVAAIFGESC